MSEGTATRFTLDPAPVHRRADPGSVGNPPFACRINSLALSADTDGSCCWIRRQLIEIDQLANAQLGPIAAMNGQPIEDPDALP